MNRVGAFRSLWWKEFAGYFRSPIAGVAAFVFLVLMALSFWKLVSMLSTGEELARILPWFFGSPLIWFSMPLLAPLLTMRLFAEERRSGTLETLLTAPVSEGTAVAAKFAGAWAFLALLWLPAFAYLAVLDHMVAGAQLMDPAASAVGYLGAVLGGSVYLAAGLLFSAASASQIAAAIGAFCVLTAGSLLALFGAYSTAAPALRRTGEYICPYLHMLEFSRGVLDTRPMIFYLSVSALLLFASARILEARKWRTP
ncbi:ABC transporter permease [Kiritimatiella glycovorans]|uniref:Gliding motility-associated ABC transporter permease protein GldF n=1 Tax=Kiritimatiella glycovorans TaxID=1307763 RepID=A0A0G3EHA0_9BACT|nr:ABC transporter permease [Kiritimatiella glycovorans]AKJ63529.1 gliding motility-associated ABC transporter permease protein GldF [Kiritimatiella glycovorans]